MAQDALHDADIVRPRIDLARQGLPGAVRAHLARQLILAGNGLDNSPGGLPGDRPGTTVFIMGSPGIAMIGLRCSRVSEHPHEMIAAQIHWGRSRHGELHAGAAELARCAYPLDAEDRAGALDHPRREHPRRGSVPLLRSGDSRLSRVGCRRAPSPSAPVRCSRLRRDSAQAVSMRILFGQPDDDATVRVI
jgi:hypothetical protein